jgi:hypothetical protein
MVVALFVLLSIQSLIYPIDMFRSHEVIVSSARCGIVIATRDVDVFGDWLWVPYPLLAALALVRPLVARRRS